MRYSGALPSASKHEGTLLSTLLKSSERCGFQEDQEAFLFHDGPEHSTVRFDSFMESPKGWRIFREWCWCNMNAKKKQGNFPWFNMIRTYVSLRFYNTPRALALSEMHFLRCQISETYCFESKNLPLKHRASSTGNSKPYGLMASYGICLGLCQCPLFKKAPVDSHNFTVKKTLPPNRHRTRLTLTTLWSDWDQVGGNLREATSGDGGQVFTSRNAISGAPQVRRPGLDFFSTMAVVGCGWHKSSGSSFGFSLNPCETSVGGRARKSSIPTLLP